MISEFVKNDLEQTWKNEAVPTLRCYPGVREAGNPLKTSVRIQGMNTEYPRLEAGSYPVGGGIRPFDMAVIQHKANFLLPFVRTRMSLEADVYRVWLIRKHGMSSQIIQ
jgi:hypothetical protein